VISGRSGGNALFLTSVLTTDFRARLASDEGDVQYSIAYQDARDWSSGSSSVGVSTPGNGRTRIGA
jgi:hypothetical protein